MPEAGGFDANHHFLNSALTSFSYYLFGSGEFALRLPNLLFFPVYLFFWFKLSGFISNRLIRWIFLLAGLFAHNLIEFFALSRGYGMSIALLTAGLYYLLKAFQENRKGYFLPAVLFILLALSANLSLLNSAILITLLMILHFFSKLQYKSAALAVLAIILCSGGIILSALRLFKMRAKGSLYYGSGEGFWRVTIRSLLKALLGLNGGFAELFFDVSLLFLICGSVYLAYKGYLTYKGLIFNPGLVITFFLFGNAAACLLLNKFFQVNFPEDRVGLYFLPLFIGSFCFISDELLKGKETGTYLQLSALPLLAFPVHFLCSANLSHASFYSTENIPHRFYKQVSAFAQQGKCPATVGGYRMRELAWDYQNFRHGGIGSLLDCNSYPQAESDFQVVVAGDLGEGLRYYEKLDYDVSSGLSLMKRKPFLKKQLLLEKQAGSSSTAGEYFDLFKGRVDSLVTASLYVEAGFSLRCTQKHFRTWLVMSVKDLKGKSLLYERLPLDWLKTSWKGDPNNLLNGLTFHNLPAGSEYLVCYLWNQDRTPYDISTSNIRIYQLKP